MHGPRQAFETVLQAARVLSRFAKSFTPADVPGRFWLCLDLDDKHAAEIGAGRLNGLAGVSSRGEIIFEFLGVRDALLLMPGKDVVRDNKLTRVMYDKPEYLVSNNLAAVQRLFNRRDPGGAVGVVFDKLRDVVMASNDDRLYDLKASLRNDSLGQRTVADYFSASGKKIESVWDLARWAHKHVPAIVKKNSYYFLEGIQAMKPDDWEPLIPCRAREGR